MNITGVMPKIWKNGLVHKMQSLLLNFSLEMKRSRDY